MSFFKFIFINFLNEWPLLGLRCNIMSLSSLFLFISAMHLRCTFLFVRSFSCSAPFFTSLLRVSAGTLNHMHAQNAHCSGFGCFFCSVCWRLRVAAASSVGMKGRKEERGSARRVTPPAGVMRAVAATAVEGRILSVCASPPLYRALAYVICYVRACWACFSGALGGHHLSMAACVSGHVRMSVRAHGMKEWLEERGIWFGGYLDRIILAAVATCTTDVFPHNGGGCDRVFRSGPSMRFGFYSTEAQWSSCNGW
ncbi:hypothetical protein TCDM_11655 [Trypanosoma cruzi Dm28c]|uniref:Uncharacterized protein n=1 Tax=Trypanosoma cruzi Dm28c TaxID=1416333 RepID=V5AZU1_TRYCR|nr:hypothetical protein TCDM_11655 [Trypanosoma cruzi Dm28c]